MTRLPAAVHSAAEVRAMDRHAIERQGIPGYTLMQRAGEAAFDLLLAAWPAARRLLIACGGGNNGGDGYVVARLAREAGLEVTVAALADPSRLAGDAARAYADYVASRGATVAFGEATVEAADVIVDALLGTGLDREVQGGLREAIEAINAAGRAVLALDLPSGLHADTGRALGAAVRADRTITFVGLKTGLFLGEGPVHAGELAFAGLGVAAPAPPPRLVRLEPDLLATLLRPRRRDAHKGDFGRVLVVGGAAGMPGAVRLAGEACLRAGAGLVTVATRPEHVAAVVSGRPELMARGVETAADLAPLIEAAEVVALGPGLGQGDWGRALFEAVLASPRRLVVDADALNLLSASPRRREDWILTPHPGEAARLLGGSAREVQADRLAAVRGLAARFGGVAVLKGAGTLVLREGGTTWVCDRGNPGMAAAGMGDVLTGVIAGLWAQFRDAESAAAAGVLVHALAGDLAASAGERGLLAGDVIGALRPCVNPP
jgi:NAD(P)H-hydrate epimerase